jgi:hypothetical protein
MPLPTSSSTAPATAAAAATTTTTLLALTTPFVQAPTCTDISTTTSIATIFPWNNYTTTTIQVQLSDVDDPRFATCQPPGWASIVPENQFSFSPAVCPSDWTAYQLEATGTLTTAWCCSRYTPLQ